MILLTLKVGPNTGIPPTAMYSGTDQAFNEAKGKTSEDIIHIIPHLKTLRLPNNIIYNSLDGIPHF